MSGATIEHSTPTFEKADDSSIWHQHLPMLAVASLAILGLFWRDGWQMVITWWDISTYNHCLLILPILYWLIHQRRDELVKITPQIWIWGLAWVGVGSFGWLLGDAAGVSLARQLGLLIMLQGAVITILGPTVTRGIIFPLFYSLFLVPFGEEFVPLLQTLTAKMSMVFLGWADIPAFIDGIFISTPTGYFEVAEACSGIKFLIAMFAYGALVSNVCFKSWKRRLLFMAAALIVPVIANGIRAFGTIYIAHHTSIDFATGFDHIFYGWFFFAFVLIIVMAIGWPFFDRKIDDEMIDGDRLATVPEIGSVRIDSKYVLAGLSTIILAPLLWTSLLAAQTSTIPDQISLPDVPGWERVEYQPLYDWEPRFDGANHKLLGRYRNQDSGLVADLSIAIYDRQEDGREIVGYGQGALDPNSEWAWNRNLSAPENGKAIELIAPGPVVRDVVSFYRIGGKLTGSGSIVKLETLKTKLLGGDQQAVAVLVSSEQTLEQSPRAAIDAFLKNLGPIDKLADEMAGLR